MTITPQNILRASVGLILTATILFLIWYFSSVVIYILVSAVLAIMGRPLVNWLVQRRVGRFNVPRWAAASLTILAMGVVFISVMSLFIPLIFNKINEFTHLDFATVMASIEEPISHAQAYLQRMFALPETHFSLADTLSDTLSQFINYNTINSTFTSIIGTALLIISFPSLVRSVTRPLMYSPRAASSSKEILPFKSIEPNLVTKVLSGFSIPMLENRPMGLNESNIRL